MKITKITVRRGATINMKNYESARLDVELGAEIDSSEDFDIAFEYIDKIVRKELSKLVDEIELKQRKLYSKAGRFGL